MTIESLAKTGDIFSHPHLYLYSFSVSNIFFIWPVFIYLITINLQ